MPATNLHTAWSRLFARALRASGIEDVVLSPGSRSTPLALAFAAEPELRVTTIVDERSAAFFALGQARASGRPSVVVCTSGTAGAHYLPAIIEASLAHVPLVVVTADRPWELQDAAAPQTIDQTKLFGGHVRLSTELGLPDAEAIPAVARIAARCASVARYPVPGPVHVDVRFRKPLEPVAVGEREPWQDAMDLHMERGAPRVMLPHPAVSDEAVERLVSLARAAKRGLLVVGPASSTRFADSGVAKRFRTALARFARATGYPIFAEAPSQARFGAETHGLVAGSFDALLRAGEPVLRAPDLLVEILSPPTSGAYAALAASSTPRVVLAEHGLPDPHGTASDFLIGDPIALLERAADGLTATRPEPSRAFADEVLALDAVAERLAGDAASDGLTEAAIPRMVVEALPDDGVLVMGNSLPVRDIDAFGGLSSRSLRVLHQRGASGIDGLVAGAAGARSVVSERAPVVLLLGDVSAQHDLGSIASLAAVTGPLVVVIVQNGGGRIFEELPIARDRGLDRELRELFVTEPDPSKKGLFESVARGFGVAYVAAHDRKTFARELATALTAPRATILEAMVSPTDGKARRARHVAQVREALSSKEPAR